MRAALVCGLVAAVLAQGPAGEKSAYERDPTGWIDLMPGKDLAGWKRVPIAPEVKLTERNPWRLGAAGKVLECDGVGIKEMLLYDREFGDGIFHVEWRFKKVEGKSGYNSGVYVRTSADGKVWHQAQVAHVDKPPLLGDLFADTPVDGKVKRVVIEGTGHKRARPVGEWNTYEITCKGKLIEVWVNGAATCTWKKCPVPRGHVGLQAEYFFIEFRNLKFKELK